MGISTYHFIVSDASQKSHSVIDNMDFSVNPKAATSNGGVDASSYDNSDEVDRSVTASEIVSAIATGLSSFSQINFGSSNGGNSNRSTVAGGGDGNADYVSKSADGYNKTLEAFEAEQSGQNRSALQTARSLALDNFNNTNDSIRALEGENESLSKMVDGDIEGALNQIKNGMQDAENNRNHAESYLEERNNDIAVIEAALSNVSTDIEDNGTIEVELEGLSNSVRDKIGLADDDICVTIQAKEGVEQDINQLVAQHTEKQTAYEAKNEAISNQESVISGKQTAYDNAITAYNNAEEEIEETVTDANGNQTTTKKQNPEKARLKAEMDSKKAELDAEKAKLDELKQEKEQIYEELKTIDDQIQIGNTTLGELLEQQHNAEIMRDNAQQTLDDYTEQIDACINTDAALTAYRDTLGADQQQALDGKTRQEQVLQMLENGEIDLANCQVKVEDAKQYATEQLAKNNKSIAEKQADKAALVEFIFKADNSIYSHPVQPAEDPGEEVVGDDESEDDIFNNFNPADYDDYSGYGSDIVGLDSHKGRRSSFNP